MNKITALSVWLVVLGISVGLDAEEIPPIVPEMPCVEMHAQHELMIHRIKEFWNHSRQNYQKVDQGKLLVRLTPSVVGLTQIHPSGHHQFILQQSRIVAEKQQERIRRRQMLLLQQWRDDACFALEESPHVSVLTQMLDEGTEPLQQNLTPLPPDCVSASSGTVAGK